MKKYIVLLLLCFSINIVGAQFKVAGTWINHQRYTSGVDAGLFRISQKLIFTTQGNDISMLKMVDPCNHVGYKANGILKFDVEANQPVNNVRDPYETWQSGQGRRLILYGQYNLPDSSANGRTWARLAFRMLALYKNGADSTKLMVTEKVHYGRYTKDNKSPRIDMGSVRLEDMYQTGQLVDSIVFTGAPGTNTGANVQAVAIGLNKSTSFAAKINLAPAEKEKLDDVIRRITEKDTDPVSDNLNANKNSTLFEFTIKSVETLQTDNESCEPQEYKNKAEYLGTLTAAVWSDQNIKRFTIGEFFDYKSTAVGSPKPLVLGINEKKPVTGNNSTVNGIPKAAFDKTTLRISGFLGEVNLVCKGTDYNHEVSMMQEANEFSAVYLKDLKSGDNTIDIKKSVKGQTIGFRIHFSVIEKN